MKIESKDLGKQTIELTIEIPQEEMVGQLEKAAQRLSHRTKIAGFRPGKAPYDMVKAAVGDMAIYQEALQDILQETYWKVLQQEKIVTVGQPEINVTKLAPGNPLVYTAKIARMPEVTLGDWKGLAVAAESVTVEKKDVDKVIDDFASMQAVEKLVERAAALGDKVEVDFDVYINGAVLEGGSGKKYPLVLGSESMIPGFEDQLIGLSAGADKKFSLTFPAEYFQSNLAGKKAEFQVKLISVFERTLPERNDEWAKKFGALSLTALESQVQENLTAERQQRANQTWEQKAVDAIIEKSTFSDFPEVLITGEVEKMKHELRHSIEQRGMKWEEYLENIKKSESDIEHDFKPQAERRIKGALVLRDIATENSIAVADEEINAEVKKMEEMYASNPQVLENIQSPGYRTYTENILINRKVMDLLRSTLQSKK